MINPKFYITDVFTKTRYGGNPLATFVDCETLSNTDMQSIAREVNFSETTFITSRSPRNGAFDVRIFTPKSEIEFAGHPVIGTAHVIRNKITTDKTDKITLNLASGRIPVQFDTRQQPAIAWMRQHKPQVGKTLDAKIIASILNLSINDLDGQFPILEVSTGFPHIVIPLTNMEALKRARINKDLYFSLVSNAWAKLMLVFCGETYEPTHRVAVRVFGDFYGIPEDAATGSGNGSLAAYLSQTKYFKSQTIDILSGQGYEIGRPSTLALRTQIIDGETAIEVGGSVIDVAEGVWY